MTAKDFNQFSNEEKLTMISCASYITKRQAGKCIVFLYSFDNFYIEVWESTDEEEINPPVAIDANSKAMNIWLNLINI